jgi:histidyl-tRNA synthetase
LERLLGIGGPPACPAGTRRAGVRLVHLDDEGEKTALAAALHLLAGLRRETGLPVTMSGQAGRKLKNQLESADRDGCRFAVIIGTRELADGIFQVRDLATGGQAGVREAEIAAHVIRQSPGIVFEEEKNA